MKAPRSAATKQGKFEMAEGVAFALFPYAASTSQEKIKHRTIILSMVSRQKRNLKKYVY